MRCVRPISTGCCVRSPCEPWRSRPSRRLGCLRTPPRWHSLGPMRTTRRRRGRRARLTGLAKTVVRTSHRCSSVWACMEMAVSPCALVCVMATAAMWKLPWRVKNVSPWAWRGGVGVWRIGRPRVAARSACVSSKRSTSARSSRAPVPLPGPRRLGAATPRLAPLAGAAWADKGRGPSALAWTECAPASGGRV